MTTNARLLLNCLPFLGQKTKVRGMGGLSMTTYGPGVRSAAADMFERGLGIASGPPPDAWCRRCREGGAEVPRPRPKGGPKGAGASRTTRGQRLEREAARLEARVAYLKKSIALKAERRSRAARGPRPRASFRGGTARPTCWGAPGSPARRAVARRPTRGGRPGRSRGTRPGRHSRGRRTGAGTGRSRCACAPSAARASRARPRSR